MISQITSALSSPSSTRQAWAFAATLALVVASQQVASVLFLRFGQSTQANIRQIISAKVIGSSFRSLERVGASRVQAALSEHSLNVASFFSNLPVVLTNAAIVVGCLVYMSLLSWQVFLLAAGVVALGSVGYHWSQVRAIKHFETAAKEQERLFKHFRSMTDGAKELRLNRKKATVFFRDVLESSIEAVRRARTRGLLIFIASTGWGNLLIFSFVGLILFVFSDVADQARVMTGFSLVVIYVVSPLQQLLLSIPEFRLASIAGARIDELIATMESNEAQVQHDAAPPLCSIDLRGVLHRYYHEKSDEYFSLGPIDLSLRPGEVVFLIGGNGSGKTTLAKLLVGLYSPEQGSIILNNETVDDSNRDRYRQLFSTVFSDFHLFETLLEARSPDLDDQGNRLLAALHLDHKVQMRDGAFTTVELSQGQRKRLALVAAVLEGRPIVVFDEWAADQDPVFKEVFYGSVLPALRDAGKTVIVITHDDRYFHLSDRLIRMESGRIIFDGEFNVDSESAINSMAGRDVLARTRSAISGSLAAN